MLAEPAAHANRSASVGSIELRNPAVSAPVMESPAPLESTTESVRWIHPIETPADQGEGGAMGSGDDDRTCSFRPIEVDDGLADGLLVGAVGIESAVGEIKILVTHLEHVDRILLSTMRRGRCRGGLRRCGLLMLARSAPSRVNTWSPSPSPWHPPCDDAGARLECQLEHLRVQVVELMAVEGGGHGPNDLVSLSRATIVNADGGGAVGDDRPEVDSPVGHQSPQRTPGLAPDGGTKHGPFAELFQHASDPESLAPGMKMDLADSVIAPVERLDGDAQEERRGEHAHIRACYVGRACCVHFPKDTREGLRSVIVAEPPPGCRALDRSVR
jgi:hypothetical protein